MQNTNMISNSFQFIDKSYLKVRDSKDFKEIFNILTKFINPSNKALKPFIINKLIKYLIEIDQDPEYRYKIFIAHYKSEICGFVISLIHPTYRSYGRKCGTFGWLHCSKNYEICKKLILKCEEFLRENKIRKIRGNINFPKGLGGMGIQTEGFDQKMLYGVAFNDKDSNIPLFLGKLGYTAESEYISMHVTEKMWSSGRKLSKNIKLGFLTLDELLERKGEIKDLIGDSFQGSFPMPDSSGDYRLLEILENYAKIPTYLYIKLSNSNLDNYSKIPEFQDAWKSCDLSEVVTWCPLAFDKKTNKIIGAIICIPDFYQTWLNEGITRINVDTAMLNKNYTGKGIFSALNNIGRITMGGNGINYFEGTYIWNNNPDAIKAIFPHGRTVRKHHVFQKRIKS